MNIFRKKNKIKLWKCCGGVRRNHREEPSDSLNSFNLKNRSAVATEDWSMGLWVSESGCISDVTAEMKSSQGDRLLLVSEFTVTHPGLLGLAGPQESQLSPVCVGPAAVLKFLLFTRGIPEMFAAWALFCLLGASWTLHKYLLAETRPQGRRPSIKNYFPI